jgi:hypothetical protein
MPSAGILSARFLPGTRGGDAGQAALPWAGAIVPPVGELGVAE